MKKTLIFTALILFVASIAFTSCSSKKKGVKCPAYSSVQKTNTVKPV